MSETRPVRRVIRLAERSEAFAPAAAAVESIGVVERVRGFMAQQTHARRDAAALGVADAVALESQQARVREIERDREAGGSVRREPARRVPRVGTEARDAFAREVAIEPREQRLEARARDLQAQVAQAQVEQFLVGKIGPERATRGAQQGQGGMSPAPRGGTRRGRTLPEAAWAVLWASTPGLGSAGPAQEEPHECER